ncbi:MAG: type II secretion system protein [Planctomycetota bacterium]|nr:MAG: type II secretion system protein [Planctomycetota bacterium]
MYRRKGFTLIELLVVIAIIALLMSILMPTLAKARRMTKAAMCMSNLKQWGSVFSMYTDDFHGSFMGGRNIGGQNWWEVLEPYYKNRALLCCPMAADPEKNPWEGYGSYGTWGPDWFPDGYYGSYCLNEWVCNPVYKTGEVPTYGDNAKYWRSTNVKGQSTIPLLGDGWWDQAWGEAFDKIPLYPGEFEGFTGDDLAHFVVLRHDGWLNMLFMDYTVRKIHIKDLWPLNWNRMTDTEEAPLVEDYPLWLKKLL